MELLEIRLSPNTVDGAIDLEVSQSGGKIDTAVRVHVDLTTEFWTKLQLHATDRGTVLLCVCGFTDCARQGEGVIDRRATSGGRLLGFPGLDECLAGLGGVAAGDVELAQYAVELVQA